MLNSKVEPMQEVVEMVRAHLEDILAWVTSREINGLFEVINRFFQAAKCKARGYGCFRGIRMVIFMIVGKLDSYGINPDVTIFPTRFSTDPLLSWALAFRVEAAGRTR